MKAFITYRDKVEVEILGFVSKPDGNTYAICKTSDDNLETIDIKNLKIIDNKLK